MSEIGTEGISIETLYNVLYGIPNRNKLTTYTAVIDVSVGSMQSWRQYCDEIDCSWW